MKREGEGEEIEKWVEGRQSPTRFLFIFLHNFLIPRLDPFLTLQKAAVGIFEFTRCVDWGFHKKMNPKKKTAESVTFLGRVVGVLTCVFFFCGTYSLR
jgi:hypothetical protein